MGGIKKAFKSVGSLLGFGGQSTPTVEKVDPTPTAVNSDDVSSDTGSGTTKKKRRGFASTQTSLANSESGGRNTLG